jgi:hypothetical protein
MSGQVELQKLGLWAVPALLPYPLCKIINELQKNNISGARSVFINHCSYSFLEGLIVKWWNNEQFRERKGPIEEAILAHKNQQYYLSICGLLPQLEGIITDWISTKLPLTKFLGNKQ